MGATVDRLDTEGWSFLHTINWMLETWKDKISLVGLDIENRGFQLYGNLTDTTDFREVLNYLMNNLDVKEK